SPSDIALLGDAPSEGKRPACPSTCIWPTDGSSPLSEHTAGRITQSRPYAEDAIEARTHLGLRLAQKRIERGKIRHVRGARQQPNEARRRRLGIELARQA